MDTFLRPDDLDVDAVLDEMREGETGFVVLPGFFEKEEIQHAKELILYLVNEWKFQGIGSVFLIFIVTFFSGCEGGAEGDAFSGIK